MCNPNLLHDEVKFSSSCGVHSLKVALVAMLSVMTEDGYEDFIRFLLKPGEFRTVRKKPRSTRRRFGEMTSSLTDTDFRSVFRMSRDTFQKLLGHIAPYLTRNRSIALPSTAGVVEPDVRLAMTLRMLAVGFYLDLLLVLETSRSMVFQVFMETKRAIKEVLTMKFVPIDNESSLKELSDGFQKSRERTNPLYGCVGSVDGTAIAIKRPPDEYVSRNFYCRIGMYALPVQAVVDSSLCFG